MRVAKIVFSSVWFWWPASLLCISIIMFVSTKDRPVVTSEDSRIEVLSTFRWPDPAHGNSAGSRASILYDHVTDSCFLYLWSGQTNGGPALAIISCDPPKLEDTPL